MDMHVYQKEVQTENEERGEERFPSLSFCWLSNAPAGNLSTAVTCRHHTHLKSPSHYLLSFWNYHTSLLGIIIFIFPHSSSPFLEVEGIMFFRPRHESNPLLFAIIWEQPFLYWINSSLHDRARVQYQRSVLNHSSSNHRFIQIFTQNYGKTFYRVNKFHHFQIIF